MRPMTVIVIKEPSIFLLKDKSNIKANGSKWTHKAYMKAYIKEEKLLKLGALITKLSLNIQNTFYFIIISF